MMMKNYIMSVDQSTAGTKAVLVVGLHNDFMPISCTAVYEPNLDEIQRNQLRAAWTDAVRRAR